MATIKYVTIKKVDLDKLLEEKNLTLTQLAKKAGVSYEYLIRINKDKFTMSEDFWNRIKKYL